MRNRVNRKAVVPGEELAQHGAAWCGTSVRG